MILLACQKIELSCGRITLPLIFFLQVTTLTKGLVAILRQKPLSKLRHDASKEQAQKGDS
jgi:hypothetical protein